MTQARTLLQQVRQHLIAAEAGLAAEKMTVFESLVTAGRLDPHEVDECTQELQDIRVLAGAAREGTKDAMRQIGEILALSRNLEVYDSRGRKVGRKTGPQRTQRY